MYVTGIKAVGTVAAVLCCASALAAGGPLDVVLLLDNSGSMRTNDPQHLMQAGVPAFVAELPRDTRLGIILFDSSARVLLELVSVSDDVFAERLSASLRRVDYRGALTDIPGAVQRAMSELKTNGRPGGRHAIVLFTDGLVDIGSALRSQERREWLTGSLAEGARDEGIRIFGVAFTAAADFQLLQTVAHTTLGSEFLVNEPREFAAVFRDIAERLNTWAEPPRQRDEDKKGRADGGHEEPFDYRWPAAAVLGFLVAGALGWGAYRTWFCMPSPAFLYRKGRVAETVKFRQKVFRIGRWRHCQWRWIHYRIRNEFDQDQEGISKFHAEIRFRGGKFFLFDNSSTYGTFIRVTDAPGRTRLHRLKAGEEVSLEKGAAVIFGDQEYVFQTAPPRRVGRHKKETTGPIDPVLLDGDLCNKCLQEPFEFEWEDFHLCAGCRAKAYAATDGEAWKVALQKEMRNRSTRYGYAGVKE
jgi:uncharacterized protein YegL